MIPDAWTPCPVCPQGIRNLYAVGRRVLVREHDARTPEYDEFYLALEAVRPLIEAHYENQLHAFSDALAEARAAVPAIAERRPLLELLEVSA